MDLAQYITANKDRLFGRWKQLIVGELEFQLAESTLANHLPDVLDDLAAAAADPSGRWSDLDSARSHGRQRMRVGFDIGKLTKEMALIGEALLVLAEEDQLTLSCAEMRLLLRVLSHGTAASVSAYAQMRDKQLAAQTSQHFSFIAHEIRNPLQNARLAASLLRTADEAARSRYLARLERSLVQLSELVSNSLIEARLVANPSLELARVDVGELVEEVEADLRESASARGLTIEVDVEPFELEADPKLLRSVLLNLVGNAIKFTHEDSRVRLAASADDQRARFEVADECGGLDLQQLEQLFEPFVQGGPDQRGHGLGLAIVRQAVDAHGGTVRAENQPGGCRFVVELPLRQPDDPEPDQG